MSRAGPWTCVPVPAVPKLHQGRFSRDECVETESSRARGRLSVGWTSRLLGRGSGARAGRQRPYRAAECCRFTAPVAPTWPGPGGAAGRGKEVVTVSVPCWRQLLRQELHCGEEPEASVRLACRRVETQGPPSTRS